MGKAAGKKREPRGIRRRTKFKLSGSLVARFWRRVEKLSSEDCWPWLGALRQGYGAIKHDGQVLSAHVVSFVIHKGAVPRNRLVTHTCDNRICCNPAHLKVRRQSSRHE